MKSTVKESVHPIKGELFATISQLTFIKAFISTKQLSQADVPFVKSSLIKTKYKTDESGKSVHFANQNNLKLRKNTPNKTRASN